MATNRKQRADSVSGALKATNTAKLVYPSWPELSVTRHEDPAMADKAQMIYNEMLLIRSPEDWRKADIPILARLAMVVAEIDKTEIMLRRTGVLVKGGKHGTATIPNPLCSYLDRLYSRLNQLSGHIGLNSLPKDSRQLGNNAQAHQMANEAISKALSYSDLI